MKILVSVMNIYMKKKEKVDGNYKKVCMCLQKNNTYNCIQNMKIITLFSKNGKTYRYFDVTIMFSETSLTCLPYNFTV